MRLKHFVALFGFCAMVTGCSPLKEVARTMICEPAKYCLGMDEAVDCCRDRELADEAWAHFVGTVADCQYSDAFACGFKAGYFDYLYAGGNGEPPVVPPRPYWRPDFQSPEGVALMVDWFRGYRLGVAVAKDSGYREAVIIPASAGLPRMMLPPPTAAPPTTPMPNADELLPPPKQLPGPKQLPAPKPQPGANGLPMSSTPSANAAAPGAATVSTLPPLAPPSMPGLPKHPE
jgi:hypothetical protein